MDVDYTRYPPGVGLAEKIVLTECPVCGKSCHERPTKKYTRYIHSVRIERKLPKAGKSGTARNVVVVTAEHRETREQIAVRKELLEKHR